MVPWLALMEECGIDLHGRERESLWRPIHRAVFEGRFEVVDALVARGVQLFQSKDDDCLLGFVEKTPPAMPSCSKPGLGLRPPDSAKPCQRLAVPENQRFDCSGHQRQGFEVKAGSKPRAASGLWRSG